MNEVLTTILTLAPLVVGFILAVYITPSDDQPPSVLPSIQVPDDWQPPTMTTEPVWEPYDPTRRYAKGVDGTEPDELPADRGWLNPTPTLPDPFRPREYR